MLDKIRLELRLKTNAFDSEILDLIRSAINDLEIVGAKLNVNDTGDDVIITDALITRAVTTYVKCNFGEPDNYDRLKASYDEQKAQLRENPKYKAKCNG